MIRRKLWLFTLFSIFVLFLVACSSAEPTAAPYTPPPPEPTATPKPTEPVPGDPVAGKIVYERECLPCHATNSQEQVVGPTLFKSGERFSLEYVRESIVHPDAPKTYESEAERPPLNAPKMPVEITNNLTDEELINVIAYVMSLK